MALSIITAPVIAAVSVGIGVPIMLAYVYGVVPISLCRGGGCGVSRGKGRGMRIDFDEDDGPITGEQDLKSYHFCLNRPNTVKYNDTNLHVCLSFMLQT